MRPPLPPARTYSHLASLGRVPSSYDIAGTGLLYYPRRGFEVEVPLSDWYRRHQTGSALVGDDWERVVDPARTTYADFVARQADAEAHVDQLVESAERPDFREGLAPDWPKRAAAVLGPVRFALHGQQMMAAYAGSMAPSGRIAVCALFQAAGEMRRIQHAAYRLAQLREDHAARADRGDRFDDGRAAWQTAPAWQPLRQLIEQALVVWDWGEALAALNLGIKPVLDQLLLDEWQRVARAARDHVWTGILASEETDAAWQRAWTAEFVKTAVELGPSNRAVLAAWTKHWGDRALEAASALAPVIASENTDAALDRVRGGQMRRLVTLGLVVT